MEFQPNQVFFTQGDAADRVFYLQKGRARLTIVSSEGKETTLAIISAGEIVGAECLVAFPGLRLSTATALDTSTVLEISRDQMICEMHHEHAFANFFLRFMLVPILCKQTDLFDQLFDASEQRLARILLFTAEFGKPGETELLIPPISEETLAKMIGATRASVSFFLDRFRKLGFISYDGRIQVHRALLNVVLFNQLPEDISMRRKLPHRKLIKAKITPIPSAQAERQDTKESARRAPRGSLNGKVQAKRSRSTGRRALKTAH